MSERTVDKLQNVIDCLRELLKNQYCSCGGWACPRCIIAVDDAKKIVPDLSD